MTPSSTPSPSRSKRGKRAGSHTIPIAPTPPAQSTDEKKGHAQLTSKNKGDAPPNQDHVDAVVHTKHSPAIIRGKGPVPTPVD